MPGEKQSEVQSYSEERSIDYGAVRIHDDHLQSGLRKVKRCRLCSEGLGGFYAPPREAQSVDEKPGVVKSGGADEKEDAALAPVDWPYSEGQEG